MTVLNAAPPNRRPGPKQEAAGHCEVKKRYRRKRDRNGEDKPDKPQDVRLAHLRWDELQRFLRYSYGAVMPNTDEARRDLEVLIGYALLTRRKPEHVAALWAPWLSASELAHMAAQRPSIDNGLGRRQGP
jgi:hypothetical protein